MKDKTYKKIEVVGTSSKSFAEAVKNGVERASSTVNHLGWFEVAELRGRIDEGRVAEFQATIKIGFRLE